MALILTLVFAAAAPERLLEDLLADRCSQCAIDCALEDPELGGQYDACMDDCALHHPRCQDSASSSAGCQHGPVSGPFRGADDCMAAQYDGLLDCLDCCNGSMACGEECWLEYAEFLPWCEGWQAAGRSICFHRRYGPYECAEQCRDAQELSFRRCQWCCPDRPENSPLDNCTRNCLDDWIDSIIWCEEAYGGHECEASP
jgi:hypothetical protein